MAASNTPEKHPASTSGHTPPSYLHRANVQDGKAHRATANFDFNPTKRYLLPKTRTYMPQYAHVYFARLRQLHQHVEQSGRAAFGPASPTLRYAKSIADACGDNVQQSKKRAKSENDEEIERQYNKNSNKSVKAESTSRKMETVLTGIIFREIKGKPSILAMYDQPSATSLIPDPPSRATAPFSTNEDKIYLEDNYARCTLDLSSLNLGTSLNLVTGLVVAVRGYESKSTGSFLVSSFVNIGPAPLISSSINENQNNEKKLLCIVSSPNGNLKELLLEQLRGTLDDDIDFSKSIVQIIIAGNVTDQPPPSSSDGTSINSNQKDDLSKPLRRTDAFLSALCATLPVIVMPGVNDATNVLLPQQPLHRCLLPSASRNENLKSVPNPLAYKIDKKLIIGTSGQNVDDIALYDQIKKEDNEEGNSLLGSTETEGKQQNKIYRPNGEKVLDILELIIMNRHLAPTCPDTLGCYPFTDIDPFVIEESPNVFFAGNQKEFATRLVKLGPSQSQSQSQSQDSRDGMDIDSNSTNNQFVRLISIPRFDETGQAVFVDLDSFEVSVREFSLPS